MLFLLFEAEPFTDGASGAVTISAPAMCLSLHIPAHVRRELRLFSTAETLPRRGFGPKRVAAVDVQIFRKDSILLLWR